MKHLLNLILLLAVSASYAQLHINSGTELYVAGDAAFYTNEDVNNQGTLTFKPATAINFTVDAGLDNSAGSIAFNDATLVVGSGTTNANSTDDFTFGTNDEVKHVVLDKNTGTTNVIGGHLGIIETLQLTSGTLTAGDKITLLNPSVGQEAYVVESTGGTANLSVEKFYPAKRAFRMVASPVDGGSIFDNWQNSGANEAGIGTHITGDNTGTEGEPNSTTGLDYTATGNPSLFSFSNANGWEAVNNTKNTDLSVGVPYRLMVRGDRGIDLNSNESFGETTLVSQGTLVTGNQNLNPVTVGSSTFYSILANPYQSRIDVSDLLNGNSGNVNTVFFYVWDPMINTRGGFVTVDDLGNGGVPSIIASSADKFVGPGESFFIRANTNNPNLQFTESMKDVSNLNPSSESVNEQAQLQLSLQDANQAVIDGIRLRFEASANNGIDGFDAGKIGNLDENLASINANSLFSIQRRNFPENDEVIPLFTNNWRNQDYSFVANLSNFGTTEVYLVDAYLGTETLLEDGEAYHFSVDTNVAESLDSQRFSLKFDTETMSMEDVDKKLFSLYPNPAVDVVQLQSNLALTDKVNLSVYNMLGQQMQIKAEAMSNTNLRLSLGHLASGVYIVQLTDQEGNSYTQELIKK
ncbi:T9SS type A sorting domain-containing protein [Psychroflexus planctonicus]|uniref:Secretion system C-terminal sorting domain-containing protein n=1 Tax=Psychroflexus planctonicus TaxID=1526575 RepID=A0ABQ1SM02_9FLAO|nr:T9SS type A sorting domain-containing protein [Psychroflexus planctonicus]GGE45265.1 hypothetical protein GCM10010832_26480 [Psychroflexus planctonicus]